MNTDPAENADRCMHCFRRRLTHWNSPMQVSSLGSTRSCGFRTVGRQTGQNPAFWLLAVPGRPKNEFCPVSRSSARKSKIRQVGYFESRRLGAVDTTSTATSPENALRQLACCSFNAPRQRLQQPAPRNHIVLRRLRLYPYRLHSDSMIEDPRLRIRCQTLPCQVCRIHSASITLSAIHRETTFRPPQASSSRQPTPPLSPAPDRAHSQGPTPWAKPLRQESRPYAPGSSHRS